MAAKKPSGKKPVQKKPAAAGKKQAPPFGAKGVVPPGDKTAPGAKKKPAPKKAAPRKKK